MLIDFSFSNHKSYRDPQQFSMSFEHNDNRLYDEWPQPDVSTVAAVYGANASGKSAFLSALMYVPRLLDSGLDLRKKDTGTNRTPYLLDMASVAHTSDYLYVFKSDDGKKYLYEVSVDDESIQYESLRVFTTGNNTAKLFERVAADGGGAEVTYGRMFTGQKKAMESWLRKDRLLLGVAGSSGVQPVKAAFDELMSIRLYYAEGFRGELRRISDDLQASPARANALSMLLDASGLGIKQIKSDPKLREDIERSMRNPESEDARLYRNIIRGLSYITMPELPDEERETDIEDVTRSFLASGGQPLLFLHEGADGSQAYLDENSESNGTQAALAFLSLALDKLSRRTVTLVDEIDTSLHPTYVEQLVNLFTNPHSNPHQSQLIFTTHDTSLIMRSGADDRPLSRDQVWIASKDREGISTLYPITSFKNVRREENLGRNYLHGIYGGLPSPTLSAAISEALKLIEDDAGSDSYE